MSEFDDRFQTLKNRFIERSAGDLEVIRRETDPGVLRPVVHRLSGAAGTFGYTELSAQAGEVDDELVEGRVPAPEMMARLISTLEALVGGPPS